MRTYHVATGSVHYFETTCGELIKGADELTKKVEEIDASRNLSPSPQNFVKSKKLVVRNNHYSCLTPSALSRLDGLLEDLTEGDAMIIIHNPPSAVAHSLRRQEGYGQIEMHSYAQERQTIHDIDDISGKISQMQANIIGQDQAIREIVGSLLYLSKSTRKQPFVIMLYGGSSLGKTETVHTIADSFFDGEIIEKHLSMFETNAYADYFFGSNPNTRSLGFELDERSSNLLFLDEVDKCQPIFHTAFYSLFDSNVYRDLTYDVDTSGLLIFLTCNYASEHDILKNLGEPIFYRIDKFIPYRTFTPSAILEITQREVRQQIDQMNLDLDYDAVYHMSAHRIMGSGENGRTIRNKVRTVIESMIMAQKL